MAWMVIVAFCNINTFGIGNYCNNVMVAKAHHADDPRLYIVYQNSLDVIGWGNDSVNLEQRKQLLELAKQMIRQEENEIKRLEQESKKQ